MPETQKLRVISAFFRDTVTQHNSIESHLPSAGDVRQGFSLASASYMSKLQTDTPLRGITQVVLATPANVVSSRKEKLWWCSLMSFSITRIYKERSDYGTMKIITSSKLTV